MSNDSGVVDVDITGFFAPMAYSRNVGYLRVRAHQLTTLADDSDSAKVQRTRFASEHLLYYRNIQD